MRLMAAGLDQRESALETRERFAFTASAAEEFMLAMKARGVESVLLSTCNRTELFVFADEDPRGILREARGEADFFFFEGADAVRHVFEVAAGLRSQIPVEDQILGQMKNALAAARAAGSCGPTLRRLFQGAITAGKDIRTEFKKHPHETSVAQRAVRRIRETLGGIEGTRALVVGSGEIGMLCASMLADEGAAVSMTRRRCRKDGAKPPRGVNVISYDDRYEAAKRSDVIVGATASPHYVLIAKDFEAPSRPLVIADLAVPRDVEPAVGDFPNVTLYDMDSLGCDALPAGLLAAIERIMDEHIARFYEWHHIHECMPMIEEIRSFAEREMAAELSGSDYDCDAVREASRNMINKLLFSLKEKVDMDMAKTCYSALAKAARE